MHPTRKPIPAPLEQVITKYLASADPQEDSYADFARADKAEAEMVRVRAVVAATRGIADPRVRLDEILKAIGGGE